MKTVAAHGFGDRARNISDAAGERFLFSGRLEIVGGWGPADSVGSLPDTPLTVQRVWTQDAGLTKHVNPSWLFVAFGNEGGAGHGIR
jgi:hypothetical protein